jgi:Domain of unknown function (DUF4388)
MALEGTLRDFSLPDIIQLISLGRKDGAVRLVGPDGEQGNIYFKNGRITSATFGETLPQDAIYTFFTWNDVSFSFVEGAEAPQSAIQLTQSNESIIMEGTQRADEWQRLRERVPTLDVVITLMSDPMVGGREINLRPDEWKVLTLINGHDDVRSIARRSGFGDFKTAKIVYNLLLTGLVQVAEKESPAPPATPGADLYEQLAVIATPQLATARVFLDDAFRRQGRDRGQPMPLDAAIGICSQFERATAMLLGPSRARTLADLMRVQVRQVYGKIERLKVKG